MSTVAGWVDRDTGRVLVIEINDGSPTFGAYRDPDFKWSIAGKGLTGAALAEFDEISDDGAVRTLLKVARIALSTELRAEETARMARNAAPLTEQELQSQMLQRRRGCASRARQRYALFQRMIRRTPNEPQDIDGNGPPGSYVRVDRERVERAQATIPDYDNNNPFHQDQLLMEVETQRLMQAAARRLRKGPQDS
jgi:hypothetical protein